MSKGCSREQRLEVGNWNVSSRKFQGTAKEVIFLAREKKQN
jgi:hypothetical protein